VAAILASGKVVAPVEVLIRMDLLEPARLEDWRRGRVPYLERVDRCNLTRLSRLLRILRFHVHDLRLVPSVTTYVRWGKGPRQPLRFTRTGDPRLERAYATHFLWPGKGPFHPPAEYETFGVNSRIFGLLRRIDERHDDVVLFACGVDSPGQRTGRGHHEFPAGTPGNARAPEKWAEKWGSSSISAERNRARPRFLGTGGPVAPS
jgi:hypothetical protein